MGLTSILSYAHKLIEERVRAGSVVVDATVGNGIDTLFLAKLVGPSGTVFGLDIHRQALDQAQERLAGELPGSEHVRLLHCSHAELLRVIPEQHHGRVLAVMFNLGYLPGCDHSVITRAESTIPALDAALRLLAKGAS